MTLRVLPRQESCSGRCCLARGRAEGMDGKGKKEIDGDGRKGWSEVWYAVKIKKII